jgi:hypothetical protein
MAIRFHCAACNQPIEVDDEWALRTVACPYCHKTVTAPAQSTLEDLAEVPVATPLRPLQANEVSSAPAYVAARDDRRNPFAIAALILAVLAFLSLLLVEIVGASHRQEMEEYARPGMTLREQLEAGSKMMEDYGGTWPGWFIAMGVLSGLSCLVWPAATVCGVVGVFRRHQRNLAVIALVICSVEVAFFLCRGVLQALG